jgi:hypothetical protein
MAVRAGNEGQRGTDTLRAGPSAYDSPTPGPERKPSSEKRLYGGLAARGPPGTPPRKGPNLRALT